MGNMPSGQPHVQVMSSSLFKQIIFFKKRPKGGSHRLEPSQNQPFSSALESILVGSFIPNAFNIVVTR
jgi:hypothetical protein